MSVPAPFVWRCLGSSAVVPFPHPAHQTDMQISRIRLSDRPHAVVRVRRHRQLEHHLELIGCPISTSFATFCVCLELRSLPSAGVTRFPRYYEPLRPPRAPGLSLTGVQLVLSSLPRPRFGVSRVLAPTGKRRLLTAHREADITVRGGGRLSWAASGPSLATPIGAESSMKRTFPPA